MAIQQQIVHVITTVNPLKLESVVCLSVCLSVLCICGCCLPIYISMQLCVLVDLSVCVCLTVCVVIVYDTLKNLLHICCICLFIDINNNIRYLFLCCYSVAGFMNRIYHPNIDEA